MPAGCARGPAAAAAAGDRRLRLARLLLVLLGWISSSTSTSSSSPSSSSTSSSSLSSSVSAKPPPPGHCPAPCECSEAARTVKCVNKNLTQVPGDLPRYVRTLFFTGNHLAVLPAGAFASRPPLAELAALNLSGSHLQNVSFDAFEHLPSLRQLDLSHNPLVVLSPFSLSGGGGSGNASGLDRSPLVELYLNNILPPGYSDLQNLSFSGMVEVLQSRGALRNLVRLELSGNNFISLPQEMFSALPKLKHLDLHNNSLVGLGNLALGNLTQLETLDLGNNALKALYNATLVQLQALPNLRVNLDSNPWRCSCELADMVAWLKETNIVEGKTTLSCFFPEKMRNRPLVKLNSSDLDCGPPPLVDPLQTSYVFLGIVLALIGAIFLLVLYLNRKGIKKWLYNIRDACRDHMEGYHYRYEINADPRLTNLSSNSDV
ncbi:trophoblast glycoprotein [Gracilinanus agilis]|uniref:trophoblast glycoprotein n=1 Tax=Gracilinanus agilis TaxID=191870 RepID=UPI001CFE355F|nr:trophoblast glycoprotein [Gracilinanus agilis]